MQVADIVKSVVRPISNKQELKVMSVYATSRIVDDWPSISAKLCFVSAARGAARGLFVINISAKATLARKHGSAVLVRNSMCVRII